MLVKKSDEEKRLVYAEVYAPIEKGMPDSDNEFMTAETIEAAAHSFLRNMRLDQIDVEHDNRVVEGCCVVESFIARKGDPDFIEGSWVVGVYVPDDETWQKIKNQELNGFSLEAMVHKVPGELEMDIPPVLSGKTDSVEDHTHEFFVSYDEEGNFLGGKTSVNMGHSHNILRGTITEVSKGHAHKFSYIELVDHG